MPVAVSVSVPVSDAVVVDAYTPAPVVLCKRRMQTMRSLR